MQRLLLSIEIEGKNKKNEVKKLAKGESIGFAANCKKL